MTESKIIGESLLYYLNFQISNEGKWQPRTASVLSWNLIILVMNEILVLDNSIIYKQISTSHLAHSPHQVKSKT